MKKVCAMLFLIVFIFNQVSYCFAEEQQADKTIDLLTTFDECLKDVNIEYELKSYLDEDSVYVNLKECIEIALLYNFYLKSADYSYIKDKWEYRNALTNFLPSLGTTGYSIYYSGQVLVGAALVDTFN